MLDPYDSDPDSAKSSYLRSSYPKSSVDIGSQHYHFLPIRRDQVPPPSQLHLHHGPAKQDVIESPRTSTSSPTHPSHQSPTSTSPSPSPSPSPPRSAAPQNSPLPFGTNQRHDPNHRRHTARIAIPSPHPAPRHHTLGGRHAGRWKRGHRTGRTRPRKWQPGAVEQGGRCRSGLRWWMVGVVRDVAGSIGGGCEGEGSGWGPLMTSEAVGCVDGVWGWSGLRGVVVLGLGWALRLRLGWWWRRW